MKISEDIPFMPEIPNQIIEAINNNSLVLFVGAGISCLAELPLWVDLAKNLIYECEKRNYITYSDRELIIASITDSKKLLTIAYEKFKQQSAEKVFWKIFKQLLTPKKGLNKETEMIFNFIQKSNALVLTTNCDTLLNQYYEHNLVHHNISRIFEWPVEGPALIKIHGCLTNVKEVIFTADKYLIQYSNNNFRDYLHTLFNRDKTILFIGYGMSEFELLDFLVLKATDIDQISQPNIFILNPYFSFEKPIIKSIDLYYNSLSLKINQIPYLKDEKNYKQLAFILDEWCSKFETTTALSANMLVKIDRLLRKNPHKDSNIISQALQLTKKEIIENYFFDQLQNSKYNIDWLEVLSNTYLFNPKLKWQSSIEETISNGQTVFKNPSWHGLRAFWMIFQEKTSDSRMIELSKVIIKNSITEIIQNPSKISNTHIISLISNIIFMNPKNYVGKDLFKYFAIINNENLEMRYLINGILSKNNKFNNWSTIDKKQLINLIFKFILKFPPDKRIYEFEKFTDLYVNILTPKISKDVFKLSKRYLNFLNKNNPYSLGNIGSIARYSNSTYNKEEIISLIIIWFKTSLRYLSVNDIQSFIKEALNKDIVPHQMASIYQKASIYAISLRFQELKNILFELPINPFDFWGLYSDLFFLIESNIKFLTIMDCERIAEWVKNSNFGENEDLKEYIKVYRYDILNLISGIDSKYEYERDLCMVDTYNSFPTPYERGKLIYSSFSSGADNDDIIVEMKGKSFNELVNYINSTNLQSRHDIYDYTKAFSTVLSDKSSLLFEDIEAYKQIPVSFYYTILSELEKFHSEDKLEDLFRIFLIMSDNLLNDFANYNIYYQLIKTIETLFKDFKSWHNKIFNFVLEIILKTEKYFFDEYECISSGILLTILNTWLCTLISFLIKLTYEAKNKEMVEQLQEYLLRLLNINNPKKWLIKACIAHNFSYVYCIDEKWAIQTLEKIFSKNTRDFSESAFAFIFIAWGNEKIYEYLRENNYFAEILHIATEEEYLNIVKDNISSWSAYMYCTQLNEIDSVLSDVIEINHPELLTKLFATISWCVENNKVAIISLETKFSSLCKKLIASKFNATYDWDQCVRYFMKNLLCMSNVDDVVWEYALVISNGFKDFLSDEFTETIIKHLPIYTNKILEIVKNTVRVGFSYCFDDSCENIHKILTAIKTMPMYKTKLYEICNILISEKQLIQFRKYFDNTDIEDL